MNSATILLLSTLTILAVTFYTWFRLRRRRLYQLADKYDGPRTLPVVGNLLNCFMHSADITEAIVEGSKYYKSPSRMWFGPHLVITIWDPENLKIFLNSPYGFSKPTYVYKPGEDMVGRGLLFSPLDEWKQHRKQLSPMFTQKNVKNFFDTFQKHAQKLVVNLRNKADAKVFNIYDDLGNYAVASILDATLDIAITDTVSSSKANKWTQNMLVAMFAKATKIWYRFDFIFENTSVGKLAREAKIEYGAFMTSILEQWESDSVHSKRESSGGSRKAVEFQKPQKFIEHLLSISDGTSTLSLEELRIELSNIIGAGIETTSASLGYILLMLGLHPDIQEDVYQEVKQVLGIRTHLDQDDLKHLELLTRVIKETLRILPAVPGTGRQTEQEIQLKNHTIPANTFVLINTLGLHRDPNIWPNPTTFDPDRFLPEEEAKRHPYSWIPFSGGPRNCIGMKFALVSIATALSTFILNYKVGTNYKSVEDIHLTVTMTMKPTNGFKISLTPR